MRYGATGYEERFYYFVLTNRSAQELTLYMINSTDAYNVTVTVIDQSTTPIEGAIVKALKYDLDTNSYILQEVGVTDTDGKTIMSLTYNDEYYKFVVEYDGETLKTTNAAYITSASYTLQVTLGEDIGTGFYEYDSLDFDISFNTGTDTFRFNYNDVYGVTTEVCLYVYEVDAQGETLVNNTCSSSAAGTLLLSVDAVNGTYYVAKAYYVDSSGTQQYLTSLGYTYPSSDVFGSLGLFLQILITLTMVSIVLVSGASVSMLFFLAPLSLLLGRIVQLNAIGYEYLTPLIVVGIIISIAMDKKA